MSDDSYLKWPCKDTLTIDMFLLRMAVEDGAQRSGKIELERQIDAQLPAGHRAQVNEIVCDTRIIEPIIDVPGYHVEYIRCE